MPDFHGPANVAIQGNVYHRIGPLLPNEGQQAEFAQIYTLDTADQLARRLQVFHGLNAQTLGALQHMLHVCCPWVQIFRTAAHAAGDARLELRTPTDPGEYGMLLLYAVTCL